MKPLFFLILFLFVETLSAQDIKRINGFFLRYTINIEFLPDSNFTKQVLIPFNNISDEEMSLLFNKLISSPELLLEYLQNENIILCDIQPNLNITSQKRKFSFRRLAIAYLSWKSFCNKVTPEFYYKTPLIDITNLAYSYSVELSVYKIWDNIEFEVLPVTSSKGNNCCGHFFSNKKHVLFESSEESIKGYVITKFKGYSKIKIKKVIR